MTERIGVYVCHCGTNIAGVVNVAEVSQWSGEKLADNGVVIARDYKFMCSSLGQELIQKDIKEQGLTRVVVAACSPHLHERTFRNACKGADLNPYLCELVSIREQDSWVHTDKVAATEKAKAIISGGVMRVAHHEALEPLRVPIHPDSLVVGGGIAGIQAALEIADAGYHVYLVEREPSIGGHMAQFDKTFPTLDCSACILTPKMVDVGNHPNITLLTWSEVTKVDGYVGNFAVTIKKKARYIKEEDCTGCGICQEKCPKKVVDDVFEAGLGNRKVVYTPFPQAVPNYPVIDAPNCTYFSKAPAKPARSSARPARLTSSRRIRILPSRWATSSWPPVGTCSTCGAFPSTVTGSLPTSTPTWSSSAWATRPARRVGTSSCGMARPFQRPSVSCTA
jgi:heterodisulfide reductase subunit A